MKKYLLILLCTMSSLILLTAEPVQAEKAPQVSAPSTQKESTEINNNTDTTEPTEKTAKSSDIPKKKNANLFMECPNALGFYGNYPLTGGITYHRWFNTFGLRLTAGGWANAKTIDYNIQLSLQGLVFNAELANWCIVGLYINGTIGHRGKKDYAYYNSTTSTSHYAYNPYEYAGIGIGMEFLFLKHISLTTEVSLFGAYPWELLMGGGGGFKIRF